MRINGPAIIQPTQIVRFDGHGRSTDHYFLITNQDGLVAGMLTVVRLTDTEGNGAEITSPVSGNGRELRIRQLVDELRPTNGAGQIQVTILPFSINQTLQIHGGNGRRIGCLGAHNQSSLCLVPYRNFAIEMGARGNLVCPHCGRRHQLGLEREAPQPCPCGNKLPNLTIPFVIPKRTVEVPVVPSS